MVVKKHILIVFNRSSGRKKIEKTLHRVLKKLIYQYEVTTVDIERETLDKALTNDIDSLVVIGGDGTVRAAVDFLQRTKSDVPILIIPRGTGNLVANSLDLPESVSAAVDILDHEKTRVVDIARTDRGDFFVGAFAMGYLSDRVLQARPDDKKRFGFFGYMVSFMRETRLPMHTFTFSIDGKEFVKQGHSLFIVNTADIFGFQSHRQISFRDGLFELVVTTNRSFWSFFGLLWDFYFRRKEPKHFFLERGKKFSLVSNRSVSTQIDGEHIDHSENIEISVLPSRQAFFIP